MGHTNYQLSDEQKKELDLVAKEMLNVIESMLCGRRDCIDPYNGRELDNNKLTAMVWYIGDYISTS